MSGFELLIKDFYFWVGLSVFVAAVIGLKRLLHALQSHSETESLMDTVDAFNGLSPMAGMPMPEAQASRPRAPEAAASEPGPDWTQLALRLDKIEQTLAKLSERVDRPAEVKLTPEMQAALKAGAADPQQLQQLAERVDKIQRILALLSGADEK